MTRRSSPNNRRLGKYSDGRDLDYGLGLFVRPLDGVKNIYHSGSTAGYRAHLNRFPDSHTSVAVLCNGSDGNATNAANDRVPPLPWEEWC